MNYKEWYNTGFTDPEETINKFKDNGTTKDTYLGRWQIHDRDSVYSGRILVYDVYMAPEDLNSGVWGKKNLSFEEAAKVLFKMNKRWNGYPGYARDFYADYGRHYTADESWLFDIALREKNRTGYWLFPTDHWVMRTYSIVTNAYNIANVLDDKSDPLYIASKKILKDFDMKGTYLTCTMSGGSDRYIRGLSFEDGKIYRYHKNESGSIYSQTRTRVCRLEHVKTIPYGPR